MTTEAKYSLGDIICVLADCPSGAESENTEGMIGIVTRTKFIDSANEWDYWISDEGDEWVFGETEIRLATDAEKHAKLKELLEKFGKRWTH